MVSNDEFRKKVKEINNMLFSHKGLHDHYIIGIMQLPDEQFNDAALKEIEEYGIALAQAHYTKHMEEFIEENKDLSKEDFINKLEEFWKPYNTDEHKLQCDVCKEYNKRLK